MAIKVNVVIFVKWDDDERYHVIMCKVAHRIVHALVRCNIHKRNNSDGTPRVSRVVIKGTRNVVGVGVINRQEFLILGVVYGKENGCTFSQ